MTILLPPTKPEKWLIACAVFGVDDSHYLLSKVSPGCGATFGLALHLLQRLQLKEKSSKCSGETCYSRMRIPRFLDDYCDIGEGYSKQLQREKEREKEREGETESIRSIVICSTRESCYATSKVIRERGKYLPLCCVDIVGGEDKHVLLKKARQGIDVGVCTIGKLCNLISHCPELLNGVEITCFDDTEITLETDGINDIIKFCSLHPCSFTIFCLFHFF